jgi:hypothetical protein
MPVDDAGDVAGEFRRVRKEIERLKIGSAPVGGGDSSHAGAGVESVQLGVDALADGDYSTAAGSDANALGANTSAFGKYALAVDDDDSAFGHYSWAENGEATALGKHAYARHAGSTALGADSATTAANQVMLGTSGDTVVVPGTFSNPSARHLKQNITPAPDQPGIFPELVEYEYIAAPGRLRLGYIADDLIGTDAERFVTFDDDGRPAGIDYLGLLVAQVAKLHARITELERG